MELRHGASYRHYMAGKAMFFPGDSVVGRWLRPHGRSRKIATATVALALLIAGSFGCRAWSVARLNALQPPGFTGTLVVALNPPGDADLSALSFAAAERAQGAADLENQPTLLYLIWDRGRLRHFLIDGGFDRDVLERLDVPDAQLYLVTASVGLPGAIGTAENLNAAEWAFSLRVRRRLRSLLYAPAGDGVVEWFELPLPPDALRGHASLPIL